MSHLVHFHHIKKWTIVILASEQFTFSLAAPIPLSSVSQLPIIPSSLPSPRCLIQYIMFVYSCLDLRTIYFKFCSPWPLSLLSLLPFLPSSIPSPRCLPQVCWWSRRWKRNHQTAQWTSTMTSHPNTTMKMCFSVRLIILYSSEGALYCTWIPCLFVYHVLGRVWLAVFISPM